MTPRLSYARVLFNSLTPGPAILRPCVVGMDTAERRVVIAGGSVLDVAVAQYGTLPVLTVRRYIRFVVSRPPPEKTGGEHGKGHPPAGGNGSHQAMP